MMVAVDLKGHVGHRQLLLRRHRPCRGSLGGRRMVIAVHVPVCIHVSVAVHVRAIHVALHVGIAVHVRLVMGMMALLRLGSCPMVMVMVALQAGRQTQRDRPSHDGVSPHEHHRPPETGHLFGLVRA